MMEARATTLTLAASMRRGGGSRRGGRVNLVRIVASGVVNAGEVAAVMLLGGG
jgi:hypothetical protein